MTSDDALDRPCRHITPANCVSLEVKPAYSLLLQKPLHAVFVILSLSRETAAHHTSSLQPLDLVP